MEGEEPQSPRLSMSSVDVSEQVSASMKLVGPFLCELLVGYKAALTKVLVTSDGRQLLSDSESVCTCVYTTCDLYMCMYVACMYACMCMCDLPFVCFIQLY